MPRKSFFALWAQYKAYFISISFLFICMVSFQNCTSQFDLEEGSAESTSLSDSTPFAFDISIDHFALMSCNTNGLSHQTQNGQFTYKWGAYQNGMAASGGAGLRFSDNFMSQYGNNVSAKIFTVLSDSEKNKNLEIVSGLYRTGEYRSRLTSNDTPLYRNDHSKLQVNFYMKDLSLNLSDTLSYFPDISVLSSAAINRNIEGVVFRRSFGRNSWRSGAKDDFTAVIDADQLTSNHLLTIGFGHASDLAEGEAKSLIGEDGGYQASTAIGRSYRPQISGVSSSHKRYLSGITENSISGSQVSSSWICPNYLRFKIVQRRDIQNTGTLLTGKVRCDPKIISALTLSSTSSEGKALRSLANVLDFSKWEVDYSGRCVVRRSTSDADDCYSEEYNPYVNVQGNFEDYSAYKVDYSSSQSICSSSDPIRTEPFVVGGISLKTFYMCPHYVSACVKLN